MFFTLFWLSKFSKIATIVLSAFADRTIADSGVAIIDEFTLGLSYDGCLRC